MPSAASENEQPHAAKVTTVSVAAQRSRRSSAQVRASNTVDAQMHSAARTCETRIAAWYEGRASAAKALTRNHDTDEKPSTTSECGVSATRPWRANVRATASVIAPTSQPLSPTRTHAATSAAN